MLRAVANIPNYVGSFTYATLPTASANSGLSAMASDIGVAPGLRVISDGTRWVPMGVQALLHSAIPVGIAPTGSMANNGAVTLGTALDIVYSGGLYLYYPLNAIVTGSAAGFYWTVMSSTTVGTVFNNTYSSGQPAVPASNTSFVTTGPGAFTGVTGATDAISLTIPGNVLGLNGGLRSEFVASHNSTAGNKTVGTKYGGSTFQQVTATTSTATRQMYRISNRGVANSQVQGIGVNTSSNFSTQSNPQFDAAVDSTASQTFAFNLTHSTATDWVILQDVLVEILA